MTDNDDVLVESAETWCDAPVRDSQPPGDEQGEDTHRPRLATRILLWVLSIVLLLLLPLAIVFIAAVLFAAAKAGGG